MAPWPGTASIELLLLGLFFAKFRDKNGFFFKGGISRWEEVAEGLSCAWLSRCAPRWYPLPASTPLV